MDSTTCSITQNEQRKSIKAKSLTVNYYKTGTLQLQGNNAQSAKDKLRATLDAGQTNCDLNDEIGDVASDRHVIVDTGLPSSVCVVDCVINGFIGDQISLSKGDALGF